MRPLLLALTLLPVADAATRPVLALDGPTADVCTDLVGTVRVRERGKDREIVVHVDDQDFPIRVPAHTTEVPFVLQLADWTPTRSVSASWKWIDTAPVDVVVPELDLSLNVTPLVDPAQGEVPPLELAVLGPCPVTDRVRLRVHDAEGRTFADTPLEAPSASVPLPLNEGAHTLSVELWAAGRQVAARQVPVEVGPPCLDADGDGAPRCHHRDCDDTDPKVFPGAKEVVGNGIDDDCDGRNGQDRDADGFEDRAVGGDDCDDRLAGVHPGATGYPDADRDGKSPVSSADFDCDGRYDLRQGPVDCDDADPAIPGVEASVPTGKDEDCDGLVDEGTVVFDDDQDGLSEEKGDCNDADRRVHPGAKETPDCRDEDCDGAIDENLTRPEQDDAYETADGEYHQVDGATYARGFFGGGYRASSTRVRAVTRDLEDVERFRVYAHDGATDTFHVTVSVSALGDGRTYEVHVGGAAGVLDGTGDSVSFPGKGGRDDSGDYDIELVPLTGELDWCPIDLVISTG